MLGIASEERKNFSAMFSYGLLHVEIPVLADQQRVTPALYRRWMLCRGLTKTE